MLINHEVDIILLLYCYFTVLINFSSSNKEYVSTGSKNGSIYLYQKPT